MLNLVGNAVKYNVDGGTVTVFCTPGHNRVDISVTDSGPGIGPEKMSLLFQPFERLGAERGAVEGTGLGLALSKGLAEAMAGTLGVASTLDVGTTFTVTLPRTEAPGIDIAVPPAIGIGPAEGHAATGTILYIEDNRSNVRLLERLMSRRPGIRLLCATSGEEGIALAARERPNLILLDLHLPDMTGEEVLDRLRTGPRSSGIAVAILSADALPSHPERLLRAGAVAYLSKPIDIARLLRLIDTRLRAIPDATM
jgi:CheY-like chemotaxis protein